MLSADGRPRRLRRRSSARSDDAQRGVVDAIATAPINKEAFRLAGLPWAGHTDLLAHLTGARARRDDVLLRRASRRAGDGAHPARRGAARADAGVARGDDRADRARAAAVRHRARRASPSPGSIRTPASTGCSATRKTTCIAPAIAACRARGIDVVGPFPADTVFVRARRGEFDVVVACYHDQGLIPVKLLAFGQAVNVTLGLPIVRTSVDHGTAFDIAGKGVADPGEHDRGGAPGRAAGTAPP